MTRRQVSDMRSKSVQKWIDDDQLRAKWWARSCDKSEHPDDGHMLGFHLSRPNGHVTRVSCFICGTLEEL